MTWTDERIESLKVLYADGLSSSQIANEMGHLTRNAVIGKVNRLGLTRASHPSSANNRAAHPRHRKPAPRRHAPFRLKPAAPPRPPVVEPMPVPEIDDSAIPLEQRRTIDQLTNVTCRWPVGTPGTPEFFFCGHESADLNIGIPYCAAHGKRATSGSPPARPFIPMRNNRS
jgi:GcrA cell cycle regulator